MKQLTSVVVLALGVVGTLRADEPKPAFHTMPVTKATLAFGIRARGTLEPEEVIDVTANVSGRIVRFGADPEDKTKTVDWCTKVNEGTVLAVLDDTLFKARVNEAEALLKSAKADLESKVATKAQADREWKRAQELKSRGGISDTDYDTAHANYEYATAAVGVSKAALVLAEAQLETAKINLGYTVIQSPVKGIIIDRRVNLGQYVEPSRSAPSLFVIVKDLRQIHMWVNVAEADVGQIKKGQEATFAVDAFPGQTFKGKVDKVRLNATKTLEVVTYTVEVSVDNTDDKLLPYLTADVLFPSGAKKNVLAIPNEALCFRPLAHQVGANYRETFRDLQADERALLKSGRPSKDCDRCVVWIETNDGLKPVRVRLGARDGKVTEVISNELKEGTPIVVGE